MSIEVAFEGHLGKPQLVRTSAKGTRRLALSVAVNVGEEKPEWVSVACFGEVMESLPGDLVRGERVYIQGRLKVSRYTDKAGAQRASLQVKASRALVLDRIGRRERPGMRSKESSDQLPDKANGESATAPLPPDNLIPFSSIRKPL